MVISFIYLMKNEVNLLIPSYIFKETVQEQGDTVLTSTKTNNDFTSGYDDSNNDK